MDEKQVIEEFGKMWNEEKNNYALVKRHDGFFGYTIMNTVYNSMTIIEEDDIAKYVIRKMLENSVRVVSDESEVRNRNRPDPISFSPEELEKYKVKSDRKDDGGNDTEKS